jgi:Abortive infection C-terminus
MDPYRFAGFDFKHDKIRYHVRNSAERASGDPGGSGLERAMFDAACAINQLRNRQGTGHGRPWLPSVTDKQAKVAVEFMANISEYLRTTLQGA